jgi:hypothetical protein
MALPWLCAALLVACADKAPKAYKHVPKVDPNMVAVGAAVGAAAITLANPKAAGRPEAYDEPEEKRPQKVEEQVPGDVLDRADQGHDDELPWCDELDETSNDGDEAREVPRIELVPRPSDGAAAPLRCRPRPSDEDAPDAGAS